MTDVHALEALGWTPGRSSEFEPYAVAGLEPGRVGIQFRGGYVLFTAAGELRADASGKLTGYTPGTEIKLVRNPNWDASTDYKPAYVDSITIKEGNDPDVASRQILEGNGMVSGDFQLPATILRLPMTYGPGDYQHRLYPYLSRMDDGRDVILLDETSAGWRSTWGYVENVTAAIALAVTDERAAGRVYNVADAGNPTLKEWVEAVNDDRRFGQWRHDVSFSPGDVMDILARHCRD